MRRKKNIILNLQNITSHFTEKKKIITLSFRNITLCSLILTLSSINIINTFLYIPSTSALSYQSSTDVKFTFNPTLSISISPSDLIIDNLTPGTNNDSNVINISVATNASHGYTLSATVGDSLHNNTNLTHTNDTNTFSSRAINSSLPNLTTDNTWGYSYKLSNNTIWNNYSGLSNESSKTLINTDNQLAKPIDFKIAAKASSTQASGTYTNTINFIAISKPIPKTIEDIVYMQTFGELVETDLQNVKDSMTLNQDYTLKDSRDEKEYYVTRLEDGNVWMTQNLDLDLSHDKPLTSNDTDLNDSTSTAYQDGYRVNDSIIYWTPERDTIAPGNLNSDTWANDYNNPYSYDKASTTTANHNSSGTYYNWTAAIASNNSSSLAKGNAANSICPKGWRLPSNSSYDFSKMLYAYNITTDEKNTPGYAEGASLQNLTSLPLWFTLDNEVYSGQIQGAYSGYYWTSTAAGGASVNRLWFYSTTVYPYGGDNLYGSRFHGNSLRCLARQPE